MPWKMTTGVAVTPDADWDLLVAVVPACTPELARRTALLDPDIGFFFHCRESMIIANPAWPAPRRFNPGDCAFFHGTPATGSAPQADGFTKNGLTVAYVNDISPEALKTVAGYVDTDGNASIDVACIFAANLGASIDKTKYTALAPHIAVPEGGTYACANAQTLATLESTVIGDLQARGITVLLTLLNNHDAAGWSNFTSEALAGNFVMQLDYIVDKYGLDGIDIDDEYSAQVAPPDSPSLAMVTSLIKRAMPGKILSKALYEDLGYFDVEYNGVTLGQTLTYGWEMTYGEAPGTRLTRYQGLIKNNALVLGFFASALYSDPAADVEWLKANGYAGVMVYAFETQANTALLGKLVTDWCGPGFWLAAH